MLHGTSRCSLLQIMSSLWSFVDAVLNPSSAVETDQLVAAAAASKQGKKRSADAALDQPNPSKRARRTDAATAQLLHAGTKRSAAVALATGSSSSSKALAAVGLEPKSKKRKSKCNQALAAQQQQQQQQSTSTAKPAVSPWYTQDEACLRDVFRCIGDGHYLVLATVCKAWCAAYKADGPLIGDRRPGIAQKLQSRSTYYQLLLHSDKYLKELWRPSMATRDWAESHDGR